MPTLYPNTLKLERRRIPRSSLRGQAMVAFSDDHGPISLVRADLVDLSPAGVGLTSPIPVAPGVRFCLYTGSFPTHHQTGTVAGCRREGDIYRIGLVCDRRAAA